MSRNNDGSGVIAVFVVIGMLLLIGLVMDACTPKCIKSGCNNDRASGSQTTGIGSSSTKRKSTYTPSTYSSYDEGYEDVYKNDDYDWDRYYSDDDYADGVDDAMDELDW